MLSQKSKLKKAEGRGQRAEGSIQKGIQTPPDWESVNKVHRELDSLTPSIRGLLSKACLLPSAFCPLPFLVNRFWILDFGFWIENLLKNERRNVKGNPLLLFTFYLLPFPFSLLPSTASALPGQTVTDVSAWINANPTLRPATGDGLRVTKSSTAAQNFTFQASVLPPGRITFPKDRGRIRTERMTLSDKINGITLYRLRESLRVIYGPTIYQDYERAKLVYDYPVPETIDLARRQNRPLLEQQQGELRMGERFAYWLEITKIDADKAFTGHLTVFLKEDIDKLEKELRDR